MDMKLLEEGKPAERTGDLTLDAYASIASRQRRRESFFRAAAFNCVCAVTFAVISSVIAGQIRKNGGKLPETGVFEDPGTVRVMLERFFILSCIPAACFLSAFTPACRAVCAACSALCGGLCGSVIYKTAALFCTFNGFCGAVSALPAAVLALFLAFATAFYSAVCVSFRLCGRRYGVTQEDKDSLFGYLMSVLSALLVLCAAALLIPELITLFTRQG